LYLNAQRDALLGGTELIEVYVASRDIPPNVALESNALTTRQIPRAFLQPGVIPVSEVPDRTKIQGVTIASIATGEQISRSKLIDGMEAPLSSDLRTMPGMVAVGIRMAESPMSVSGLVRAGDRVDVLASFQFEKPGAASEPFTEIRPLFMNVAVVAVNQTTQSTRQAPRDPTLDVALLEVTTVTLALPPPNAQQLVLAQQLGDVWLLLRAQGDAAPFDYEVWNNERLLGSANKLFRAQESQSALIRSLSGR
ncbi:MAG TPA: Flp pilus assembly protein CpaB, partial [Thermoanaerobaculia bacterium]|nr:Flp pilus assembly protein CpaB [Thermoanaerobaculia bacterium]